MSDQKKMSLEGTIRSLLFEQNEKKYPASQWEKEKKPRIVIAQNPHDPTGPNMSHIEEDMPGSQFGMRHNPRQHPIKKTLGALEKRRWGGNQRRTPASYNEEVKDKFKEKVAAKRAGKTATGQPAEVFNPEPELRSLQNTTR
jgi:hypothetical protein